MIRPCTSSDFETSYGIINDAAEAYCGVIPADRWKVPYMSRDELQHQIDAGVVFWGYEENSTLVGVMGIQDVKDVQHQPSRPQYRCPDGGRQRHVHGTARRHDPHDGLAHDGAIAFGHHH